MLDLFLASWVFFTVISIVTACNRGAIAHYIDLNGPTWTRDSSILKASLKVRYVIGTKFPRVSSVFLRELWRRMRDLGLKWSPRVPLVDQQGSYLLLCVQHGEWPTLGGNINDGSLACQSSGRRIRKNVRLAPIKNWLANKELRQDPLTTQTGMRQLENVALDEVGSLWVLYLSLYKLCKLRGQSDSQKDKGKRRYRRQRGEAWQRRGQMGLHPSRETFLDFCIRSVRIEFSEETKDENSDHP